MTPCALGLLIHKRSFHSKHRRTGRTGTSIKLYVSTKKPIWYLVSMLPKAPIAAPGRCDTLLHEGGKARPFCGTTGVMAAFWDTMEVFF
jgi:hypothetical protein